jgi:hypothetical protein
VLPTDPGDDHQLDFETTNVVRRPCAELAGGIGPANCQRMSGANKGSPAAPPDVQRLFCRCALFFFRGTPENPTGGGMLISHWQRDRGAHLPG